MKSKYRDWILPITVLAILLAFTPHALYRVIKTGNPYLFTSDFFGDILARLHGPGRFRFILQPTVAMLLGIRDGRNDAHEGAAPFLWGLIFHKELRPQLLKHMLLPGGVCLMTDQDRVPSFLLRETLAGSALTFTTQTMRAGQPGGRRFRGSLYRITHAAGTA